MKGTKTIQINPMGKPRMTRQDRWKKRPVVLRYWTYKDELKEAVALPEDVINLSWDAYFAMPKSWSKKKKALLKGKSHRNKPDRDNVDKGILDALLFEDCAVAHGTLNKYWDDGGGARIELSWEESDDDKS